jgi:tRNA(fMet)-specific endonuclease VapC
MSPAAHRGILDTSTVILLPRLKDPSALPDEPVISAVTLAELSVGPLVAGNDVERVARQAHLREAEADRCGSGQVFRTRAWVLRIS